MRTPHPPIPQRIVAGHSLEAILKTQRQAYGDSFMLVPTHASVQFGLPIITCPTCGSHMRLTTIIPDEYRRERMIFVCKCGFDYHESIAVAVERSL